MNNVREVNRINEKELELAVEGGASWHDDYKDSAYIFVGGLDKRLTEGDVITIFSQYGEILDINLPRIPEGGLRDRNGDTQDGNRPPQSQQQQQQAGKPGDRRGFGFLLYEDQRSTVLAVDNLNGFNLLGRTIRVDHVKDYKMPGAKKKEEEGELVGPSRNAAPALLDESAAGSEEDEKEEQLDLADPMASYIADSKKAKSGSREEKEERRRRKEERRRKREERERRRRDGSDVSKRKRSEESYDRSRSSRDRGNEREHDQRDDDRERPRYRQDEHYRDDRRRDYTSRDDYRRDRSDDYRDRPSHRDR